MQFPDPSFLWKIPAHCGSQQHVLDEKGIKDHLSRLHAVKPVGDRASHSVRSEVLWETDELKAWNNPASSSFLMVKGSFNLVECMRDFALQVVESCEGAAMPDVVGTDGGGGMNTHSVVAYLLDPNPIRNFPRQYKYPGATEVLRQITMQILRQVASFVHPSTCNL